MGRLRIFAFRASLVLLVAGIAFVAVVAAFPAGRQRLVRAATLGAALIEVQSPPPGAIVPPGGVQVAVRFPWSDRTAVSTFRCLLNGRPVTSRLTHGHAGAVGSVRGLVEGRNRLRFEVFGRSWWRAGWFEDSTEVVFTVRPHGQLDRASLDTSGRALRLPPASVRGPVVPPPTSETRG